MKDLGANLAEYNRLVTQPEYLEQRWKEVVAEWKAAVEEQNLGLPEAKELLHQKLKENQLLSLSRDHEYGNENAEHREWALYVGFRHRSLLEQWYRTLPEKLDIPAEKLDQTMATFLDGQSIDRRIYMTFEQRKAWDGAMGELQDALLEYFQANGIVLTQSEAKRIALLHLEYEQKAKEERRLAEQKAAEEKRLAEQKAAEEKRLAERKAAEEKRLAARKAAEEKRLAEEKAAEERKGIETALLEAWRKEVIEKGITESQKALERLVWLCGDKDKERDEKYYDDFGNFDGLQRKAMASWNEIEPEARKTAHEMFLEMCEEPSFVYPSTDICDSSVPIYQDFKSGMSYAYVSGTEQEMIEILRKKGTYVNQVETKRAEINSKRLYLKRTPHPTGEDSRVWPLFYFAYNDMESANGVLIGMSLELFASQVPIEAAVAKYQQMFEGGLKKNDDGSYTGDNGKLLVHIYRTRQTAFGETNIEVFDLAQVDAYNKLYLEREAELKKAAEEAARAKTDALLNF